MRAKNRKPRGFSYLILSLKTLTSCALLYLCFSRFFTFLCREEKERKKEEKKEEERRKRAEAREKEREATAAASAAANAAAAAASLAAANALSNAEMYNSLAVEIDEDREMADVEDNDLDNDLENEVDIDVEEDEEEEEDEEPEGYAFPIGPMPQMVTNDLKSLDEMVSLSRAYFDLVL